MKIFVVIVILALVSSSGFGLNFGKKHRLPPVWRPFPYKLNFMDYINDILNNPQFMMLPTEQKLNIFVEIYNNMDKFNLKN